MAAPWLVTVTMSTNKGGNEMDSTHEFVEKLHEKQKKAEQNKKRQGNGSPSEKLPTKRH